ncbi:MAG TPA: TMEM175 family protein [Thermoanaerobaculia bacterium]|nr:TMEM175 family protein [Thermoanaerobaculia bacterium]
MQKMIPFRWRGREVSRVEAFSDVVFGFALTLIVVSLEGPQTFQELMNTMRGFPAFAICFAILTWVWYVHHVFFKRYALTDDLTIALNAVLLFIVLFYTYPLKYMFSLVTGQIRINEGGNELMVIYGVGFAGIFAMFLAMYAHAWRLRDQLDLNELERWDTRTAMIMYASYIAIGLVSALAGGTLEGESVKWAGLMYWLLGPVSGLIGWWRGSGRARLQTSLQRPLEMT